MPNKNHVKKIVFRILLLTFITFNLQSKKHKDDLEWQIQQEIENQLSQIISSKINAKNVAEKHKKTIPSRVNKEIKKQHFNSLRNYEKKKVYGNTNFTKLPGIKDDYFII